MNRWLGFICEAAFMAGYLIAGCLIYGLCFWHIFDIKTGKVISNWRLLAFTISLFPYSFGFCWTYMRIVMYWGKRRDMENNRVGFDVICK